MLVAEGIFGLVGLLIKLVCWFFWGVGVTAGWVVSHPIISLVLVLCAAPIAARLLQPR